MSSHYVPAHVIPAFSKHYSVYHDREFLDIPRKWVSRHGHRTPDSCTLELVNGLQWSVHLTKSRYVTWCFDGGWSEFVRGARIEPNDFLVFLYNGDGVFQVLRFNDQGWMPMRDLTSVEDLAMQLRRDGDTSSDDTGVER
ncbi:B3 domain-containing protein At5g57720-like isoform X1 [Salvia splendens]|uniref:B3 domain-containing protein At5g57720-like isoform X1 n=1 Tax=Salvia splendens TaxID=180675 RepID=UPI001C2648DE|nr:B3 domain-containing protein At5g57720-like isoform X1 [Salvia splendens]